MEILSSFKKIVDRNIDELLDKCDDSAKLKNHFLIELQEELKEAEKAIAVMEADEKKFGSETADCERQIIRYTIQAQNALKSCNQDEAEKIIALKRQCESQMSLLKKKHTTVNGNLKKLKQIHDKLVSDIAILEQY